MLQEGPQLLPEDQKPSHGLPEGLLTAKLPGNFWRHLSCFHVADNYVHWNILVKSHKKANSVATQTISAEPGVHSGHSSSGGTSQPGQVRSRPMLTTVPSFSSETQIFPSHSHFAVMTMPVPLTRALRAEKRLCWRIKPKAPMGATEDQIIHMGENLWNCCIKLQVKKQEKKWKEHLLFKALLPGK